MCVGSFLFYITPIVFNSNFVPFDGLDDLDGFYDLEKTLMILLTLVVLILLMTLTIEDFEDLQLMTSCFVSFV